MDIAQGLGKKVCVITDNDGNEEFLNQVKQKNLNNNDIKIFTDNDINNWTFEVALYNLNKTVLEDIIKIQDDAEYKFNGVSYKDRPVLGYMLNNKADIAYKLFSPSENNLTKFTYPNYIKEAIKWIRN